MYKVGALWPAAVVVISIPARLSADAERARPAGGRKERLGDDIIILPTAAADGCALVLTTSWRAVAAVEPPTNQCSRNRCNTTVRVCVMFTECKLKHTHAATSSGSFRGAQ